ncbi:hypothetical protein HYH03_006289 [Edaphochlamys debaryana]|uniref:Uncharacterized protein n=1 Tax=Edaphochlamys debaryana TaxID=47281 RepID=A0A835Y5T5_9CHLO|nr:hypothetical protein HYH03_006289 [Edaphochlamys debaryana]|eukprot:KAG2495689.1 hypothetical protein HYH03_006289 [Edaphochlamys debaryana]
MADIASEPDAAAHDGNSTVAKVLRKISVPAAEELLAVLQGECPADADARLVCKCFRDFVDGHVTHVCLRAESANSSLPPPPLERWPRVSELTLELNPWTRKAMKDPVQAALESGPLLALPFIGVPLAARQRITKLHVCSSEKCKSFQVPAVAISSLSNYLPNLRELHLSAVLYSGDHTAVPVHARQMYDALAVGMPRLEALTLPHCGDWLSGVEALQGLRRLAVAPDEMHGSVQGHLSTTTAQALRQLRSLEELSFMMGRQSPPEALLDLLEGLPAAMQHVSIKEYYFTRDGDELSLDLVLRDGLIREIQYDGCMGMLALIAHRLARAGRLADRLQRLSLPALHTPTPLLAQGGVDLEVALGALRRRCTGVDLRALHLHRSAPQEPALAAALLAVHLFGVPASVTLEQPIIGGVLLPVTVDTSLLAAAAGQGPAPAAASSAPRDATAAVWAGSSGGGGSGPRLPEPEAVLAEVVGGLLEAHRDEPFETQRSARDFYYSSPHTWTIVAHGSLFDHIPEDLAGAHTWLTGVLPRGRRNAAYSAYVGEDRYEERRALLLRPASALLVECGEDHAAQMRKALAAAAAAQGAAVDIVCMGSATSFTPNPEVVVQERTTAVMQAALDTAAPWLSAVECLRWLFRVREVLKAMPDEMRV